MFGFSKMTHSGTAKVVSCEMRMRGMTKTDSKGRSSCTFDVILDVYPDAAQPFRAQTKQWFSELRYPDPGDTLKVRCNPEKKTVKIDLTGDERFNPEIFRKENEETRKREHDDLLNAPVGTPVSDDPPFRPEKFDPKTMKFDSQTGMIVEQQQSDDK